MRLIIGIFVWKRGSWANSEQNWKAVHSYQKTKKELNFWLKLNGRNTGISKHLLKLFEDYLLETTSFYISWNHTGKRPKFKKKNYKDVACNELKIFRGNNKTIIKCMEDLCNEIHNSCSCEKKAPKNSDLLWFEPWSSW